MKKKWLLFGLIALMINLSSCYVEGGYSGEHHHYGHHRHHHGGEVIIR